jgi:hypothetical protein
MYFTNLAFSGLRYFLHGLQQVLTGREIVRLTLHAGSMRGENFHNCCVLRSLIMIKFLEDFGCTNPPFKSKTRIALILNIPAWLWYSVF